MSEIRDRLLELNEELEKLLYDLINLYKSETTPRRKIELDRVIRRILRACGEVYQSSLIMIALYPEVKKDDKEH